MRRTVLFVAAGSFIMSASCDKIIPVKLDTDSKKAGYGIGRQIGQSIKAQRMEVDLAALNKGIKDEVEGKEAAITQEEIREAMERLATAAKEGRQKESEKNLESAKTYLAENAKKEGIKATESGLQYQVIEQGTGAKPKATSSVKVHYKGELTDGTVFDSSYERGEPATFPLNGVIPGWTEGIQLMNAGGKFKFFIPPDMAYGPEGNARIPGNSVLVFEVELLEVDPK